MSGRAKPSVRAGGNGGARAEPLVVKKRIEASKRRDNFLCCYDNRH